MLHIKLKGMKHKRKCKHVDLSHNLTSGFGFKGQYLNCAFKYIFFIDLRILTLLHN